MPTSLVGLLLFIILLAPGFAFVVRRETRFVPRTTSVFRETAAVVLASVTANGIALAGFGVIRTLVPERTPDVGRLVNGPAAYFTHHYVEVAVWGAALLAVAVLLAALAAVPPQPVIARWRKLPEALQPAWLEDLGNPIIYKSAWDRLMHLGAADYEGPVDVWVSCELHDGTYLAGPLYSLNPDVDEDADREFIIMAPITRRGPTSEELEELDVGALSVSARYVKYVGWSYVRRVST